MAEAMDQTNGPLVSPTSQEVCAAKAEIAAALLGANPDSLETFRDDLGSTDLSVPSWAGGVLVRLVCTNPGAGFPVLGQLNEIISKRVPPPQTPKFPANYWNL